MKSFRRAMAFGLLSLAFAIPTARAEEDGSGNEVAPMPHQMAPHPRRAGTPRDWQDVVVLGDDRPHLLRFRIRIDNKPMSLDEDVYLEKLWRYLDSNEKGWLTKAEAARAPAAALLLQVRASGFFGNGGWAGVPFEDFDKNKDGKVSRIEFYDYYHRSGFTQVWVVDAKGVDQNAQGDQSSNITETLFRLLDTDGDGKLSKEEIKNAEKVLMRLDTDEDGMVSLYEIIGNTNFNAFQGVQNGASSLPYAFLQVGVDPSKTAASILAFYDKDKNGKLSRKEIGFDKALFDSLDLDHDESLSVKELTHFLELPPESTILTRLGRREESDEQIELFGADGKTRHEDDSVKKTKRGVTLKMSDVRLDVSRSATGASPNYNMADSYAYIFQNPEVKKKGYLDKDDFEKNPQLMYFKGFFQPADRNGDGKLTEKEFREFFKVLSDAANGFITVAIAEKDFNLFEVLDADLNGSLSAKELSTLWDRLAPYDRNGDGMISRQELASHYFITVSKGKPIPNQANANRVFRGVQPQQANARVTIQGPIWFRKMDINADKKLSRDEFLGSDEDFKKIDTNGDGFISLEEAQKYDDAMKQAKLEATTPKKYLRGPVIAIESQITLAMGEKKQVKTTVDWKAYDGEKLKIKFEASEGLSIPKEVEISDEALEFDLTGAKPGEYTLKLTPFNGNVQVGRTVTMTVVVSEQANMPRKKRKVITPLEE